MGSWLAADWFRPLRNAGLLLTGRLVRGLLGLASVAVAARALGTETFGVMVLVSGTVGTFSKVLRLPSGEMLISYGADPLQKGDRDQFQQLLGFGVLLDLLSAGAALGLLMLLAPAAIGWFGLPEDSAALLRAYALILPFVALGITPSGILHLLDRYDIQAWLPPLIPLGRLGGGLILLATGAGLGPFLGLWALTTVSTRLVRIGAAIRELNHYGLFQGKARAGGLPLRPVQGIWRFVAGAYTNKSLNLNKTQLPLLAVGATLGPPGAALYRIALQLANIVIKPANNFLVTAIFPDLANLTAGERRSERQHMVKRTGAFAGSAALGIFTVLAVAGHSLISWTVGPAYTDAYGTMLLLALAGVCMAWVFPLEPLLVSSGQVTNLALSRSLTFGVYLGVLVPATELLGLLGAGLAALVQAAFMVGMLIWLSRGPMQKEEGRMQGLGKQPGQARKMSAGTFWKGAGKKASHKSDG